VTGPRSARRIALGPGPSALHLVRRADGWDGLVALVGAWADGTPLLTSHPLRVVDGAALEVAAVLDEPVVVVDPPAGFVGGGWFGRLAFDGASRLAFHDHVVRLIDDRWWFEAVWSAERADELDRRLADWRGLLTAADASPSWQVGPMAAPADEQHLAAVEQAVELIRAGELYQVNVCTRLAGAFAGRPAGLFAEVAGQLAPQYGAYLAGEAAVVSLSPELFLRRRGRMVESSPIKGTLPRDAPGNDRALRRSAKDAAENVMIVDLVRNDLGRVSEIGSVRPTALLEVQPHPGVWHLVSTVRGRLRRDAGDTALIAAAFPPGSVTGAPKVRALEAIAALEAAPRGTYTGAVGFASPVWGAEFNVAIRTFEITGDRIELGVGGGITADSVPVLEWRECGHKAAPLLRAAGTMWPGAPAAATPDPALLAGGLLETILAVDGRILRLADHLARLDRSSRELYGAGLPEDVADRVRALALGAGRVAVRVVVRPDLGVAVSAAPVGAPPVASDLVSVPRPPGVWRHKWADRSWVAAGPAAPLYVAADGAVLETERGNVFLIAADGTLVTPPLRDDLLPGVTRRAVLDRARDDGRPTELRTFSLDELGRRPAFWTSSLSGAVPIHRVDGAALPRADELVAEVARTLFGGDVLIR
jgi:para-aminobenzoate synthetase/4-amino-4-deoxychorismate lyase